MVVADWPTKTWGPDGEWPIADEADPGVVREGTVVNEARSRIAALSVEQCVEKWKVAMVRTAFTNGMVDFRAVVRTGMGTRSFRRKVCRSGSLEAIWR